MINPFKDLQEQFETDERKVNQKYQDYLTMINTPGFKHMIRDVEILLDQYEKNIKEKTCKDREWKAGFASALEYILKLPEYTKIQLLNLQRERKRLAQYEDQY